MAVCGSRRKASRKHDGEETWHSGDSRTASQKCSACGVQKPKADFDGKCSLDKATIGFLILVLQGE